MHQVVVSFVKTDTVKIILRGLNEFLYIFCTFITQSGSKSVSDIYTLRFRAFMSFETFGMRKTVFCACAVKPYNNLKVRRLSHSSHTTSQNASFTNFIYFSTDVERKFLTTASAFYDIRQCNVQYVTCRYVIIIGGTLNIYIGAKRCGLPCKG
jgi:hypothetical protein